MNIFLSLKSPCTFLPEKEKNWKLIFNTNSELFQNRTEKQIILCETTVNRPFKWCYLVIACFDWTIGIFQEFIMSLTKNISNHQKWSFKYLWASGFFLLSSAYCFMYHILHEILCNHCLPCVILAHTIMLSWGMPSKNIVFQYSVFIMDTLNDRSADFCNSNAQSQRGLNGPNFS